MAERRKLDVVIEPYDALPCELEKFIINGIDAYKGDFGDGYDSDPDNAEEYGCGNHQFESKMPTDGVLEKYSINLEEYAQICEMLESALDVGGCGWCV